MSVRIVLILFAVTLSASAQNCNSTYDFDGSSCVFNVLNADSSCSSFHLINCTWK